MRISDWSSDVCSSDLTMIAAPGAPVARGIRGGSAGSSSWITGGGKLFLTACRRATGRAFPPPSGIARSAATKRPRTTAPKLAMLPGLLRLRLAMTVGGKRGGAVRPSPNPGSAEQPHQVLRHLVGLRHHRDAGLDQDLLAGELRHLGRDVEVEQLAQCRFLVPIGGAACREQVLQ